MAKLIDFPKLTEYDSNGIAPL